MERRIAEFLEQREAEGLLRGLTPVQRLGGGKIRVNGREYTDLSSNDYLGLSSHPEIRKSAMEALSPVFGSAASRLMTGSSLLHHILENRVSAFKKKPAAVVFNSGYQANVGVISALCGKGDCVFFDRLSHASILDGIKLSGARPFRFRHNDTGHLEELLARERGRYRGAMVITETVFSMDGDLAPLEEIVRLKERYNCVMMADEAHATGIFGKNGTGMAEEKGVSGKVDILMGTFSKALGGFGAYVATALDVRDYLVNTARSFIYSTSLPPAVIAADITALGLIENEPYRRRVLLSNADHLRGELKKTGFTVTGDSQIIPVITGDNAGTVRISEYLRGKGWWVTPVRPPTVPEGKARLRISLSYDHTKETLDRFIRDIADVKRNRRT
ncbi:MAG: 8-amino-7-oxononanoate synthase [Candidatus Omnitrophota bacterium]